MNELIIDKEFEALIPNLKTEEFEQLEKNILSEGCRDSLIVWNNILIDGHNRYKICSQRGIDFKTSLKDFGSRDEVKQWIILNQFGRRNLSAYDRSILALQLEEMISAKAKENQALYNNRTLCQISDNLNKLSENHILQKSVKTGDKELTKETKDMQTFENLNEEENYTSFKKIDTKKELAHIAGVSHDTIHKVKTIKEKAPEEVRQAVKDNVISINKGYQITKHIESLPQDKRESELTKLTDDIKKIDDDLKKYKVICSAIIGVFNIKPENLDSWFETFHKEELDARLDDTRAAIDRLRTVEMYLLKQKNKKRS